jgi:hypothetical protein
MMRDALKTFLTNPIAPAVLIGVGAGLVALGSLIGARTSNIAKGATAGSGSRSLPGGNNTLLGSTGNLADIKATGGTQPAPDPYVSLSQMRMSGPAPQFAPQSADSMGVYSGGLFETRVTGELVGSGRNLLAVMKEEIAAQKRMGVRDPLGVNA